MKLLRRISGILFVLCFTASVQGAVIVDNFSAQIDGTSWTNDGTFFVVWDDFTLATDASVNEIKYWNLQIAGNLTSDFTLNIGTAAGLSDIANLTISNASATISAFGVDDSLVEASFASINLSAGTTYWLAFYSPDNLFGSALALGESLTQITLQTNTPNVRNDSASSFQLLGTNANVPAPASIVLLGLGLAAIGYTRRKQKS